MATEDKDREKEKEKEKQPPRQDEGEKTKPAEAPKLPEQQLGDTPVAPWDMPTPEEKAEAKPVSQALKQAVEKVDTPAKAEAVADELINVAAGRSVDEAAKESQAAQPSKPGEDLADSAQVVKEAARPAPPVEKAANVIAATAQEIAGSAPREREALSQAAQEVLNPEQQGAPPDAAAHHRQYLREAFLKRMRPMDATDARLFLAINHLPHNRVLNGFFYMLTMIFKGGAAWFGLIGLTALLNRRSGWAAARQAVVPLAVATSIVEFPVKAFFRRRRPFIAVIQAVVIGKKPGTWSFPSGHSAAAFGGAWLLGRCFPRLRWLFFIVAGLVAFSRIYLGDHYPGDVFSGSVAGVALAETTWRLQKEAGQRGKKWRKRRSKTDSM
jgi:undecaprenyl-diphosphatase